jgi:hypothetical protein
MPLDQETASHADLSWRLRGRLDFEQLHLANEACCSGKRFFRPMDPSHEYFPAGSRTYSIRIRLVRIGLCSSKELGHPGEKSSRHRSPFQRWRLLHQKVEKQLPRFTKNACSNTRCRKLCIPDLFPDKCAARGQQTCGRLPMSGAICLCDMASKTNSNQPSLDYFPYTSTLKFPGLAVASG